MLDRRELLKLGLLSALTPAAATPPASAKPLPEREQQNQTRADYTIRIAAGLVELGPDKIVSTTLYNGQFPGELLRFYAGTPVTIDIHNDTDTPEQLHWHGQAVPADVDGAAEEGTPFIPPHGGRRITLTPGPSGFRFYHTHVHAGADLAKGQYGGQVGPVYIEPKQHAGDYDREVFLVLKEFGPMLSRGGDMPMNFLVPAARVPALEDAGESAMKASLASGKPHGYEVGYDLFSINGRMLGHGEPIRVSTGERVLLHVLNGSATEIRSLALPGHTFRVVALDGNPVPTPADVPALWLGTGERVSAIVQMKTPGVWILGDTSNDDRRHGMGIVVEYAGRRGQPAWITPKPFHWDYTRFGTSAVPPAPDETIQLTFAKNNAAADGFNQWTIDGKPFSTDAPARLAQLNAGRRYRLRMRNASDDIHPIHLHRHTFELTSVGGKRTSGVMKDVVMVGGYQETDVDFVANNPGPTLFHCHQQLHMDFGFMGLFTYA
jgi:FtsP/CotA-like multicopper oxidase with cupredoxin domain